MFSKSLLLVKNNTVNMDTICFTVNGERYTLRSTDVSSDTSLNEYLRNYLQLHDTKAMCQEGGCGACIVSVSATHPATKEKHAFSVNSCLVSILSCHEWDITTVQGIGNRKDGYNPIQVTLAAFHGTQCGYCTPGWVTSMYSLMQSNSSLSTKQVENSFGGNMCRCTGYRPILDSLKTFAKDLEPELRNKIQDLEDLHLTKCAKKCERKCSISEDWCLIENKPASLMELSTVDGKWFKAYKLEDVFQILSRTGNGSYRLVAGNTGKGVYPISLEPHTIIDISSIDSLKLAVSDENLILGAGMSLTEVMSTFKKWSKSKSNEYFRYLDTFYDHLDLVAHVPVRNIGTIGGNLALKNLHHEFPSDVFLLLATAGATVTVVDSSLRKSELKMSSFMKTDLKNKMITEVKLPPLSSNHLIRTYKIMPRAQNAHAIVNAGFHFKVDGKNTIQSANIAFGHISPSFIFALETEKILMGLKLDDKGLRAALTKLNEEIVPVELPPEPSPDCRKWIALGLFYKAFLSLAEQNVKVNPRYKSGASLLSRGVSHGMQTYETDKTLWPLNKPVQKLEALAQCAGEAMYTCDVYPGPRGVHVAFVLSEICRGELLGFDTTNVLKVPGVIGFFSAKDIPGKNTFIPTTIPWMTYEEEIFASSKISFYGQPLGVVVANTKKLAETAAKMIKVKYKKSDAKPVLNIRDALVAKDKDKRIRQDAKVVAKSKGRNIQHTFSGSYTTPSQYHYTMETQCCYVEIKDSTVVVRSSTQWLDLTNVAVAGTLGIDESKVLVEVSRIGGGYGGKASRASQPACACALVAYKLNRPATLEMSIKDNMDAIGKRHRCDFDYECGVDDNGVLQYLNVTYYSDCGCTYNDTPVADIATAITNLYVSDTFNITGYGVLTDKPSETWCRAPANIEGMSFIEHIMERISLATGKDHVEVRLANLKQEHADIRDMITTFNEDAELEDRKAAVTKFNKENAWKKKGLRVGIMAYPIPYSWNFPVTISIYHADGTIAISHGGIEMGQGLNTKVAQVCAYALKVPLEKVSFRNTNSFVSPNAMVTNGSITSDCLAFGTIKACEELLKRLEPTRRALNNPTWEELVQKAFQDGVNLQASHMTSSNDGLVDYNVYGICATEVELDVLTGNHIIRRLDIQEDTGISMSPDIDIGQIEGAVVMGLGLWTSEHLIYDKDSGKLLTDRTWTYKPPGAKDIPEDFRVKFRPKASNTAGVLRSKATGEPAIVLSVVLTHALHEAILEARKEYGYEDKDWVFVDSPYTIENMLKAISPKIDSYRLT